MNIPPEALLVVKLEAQQWNIVIAGLGELQQKFSGPVLELLMQQFREQMPAPTNGIDHHAPAQFTEPSDDPVRRHSED